MAIRWRSIVGLLFVTPLFAGFMPSTGFLQLPLVPDSRSAEFTSLPEAKTPDSEQVSEWELLAITNRDRIQQGLQPLVLDETLMQIAREHSMEMARQGFISHDQPSGNLQIRLSRVGYSYEAARENVASARTVSRAHAALLNSPSHKDNILATDVTRVGIGIARYPSQCKNYLYITEVFAAPREVYAPSMVQNILADRVEELRNQGAGAMDLDPLLNKMASRSLESLSVPYNREELRSLLSASASELREEAKSDLSGLEVSVQLLRNPRKLNIPASRRQGLARMYGSAIRQITDNSNQPAFLVLTLVGVTR